MDMDSPQHGPLLFRTDLAYRGIWIILGHPIYGGKQKSGPKNA